MKRRLRLLLLLALLAVLAAACSLAIFLRSERFQNFLRVELASRIAAETGLECRIGGFRFDPFRGDFSIRDFSLGPLEDHAAPMRVGIDEVRGRFSFRSFFQLKPNLDGVSIVRPRIALVSKGGEGRWNPGEFLKSFQRSIDLEVGSVEIVQGWVELNHRGIPLELSVRDVLCQTRYRSDLPGYRVRLEYRDALLHWAERDIRYDLRTSFSVSMQGVDVDSIEVAHRETRLRGTGWFRDWKSPAALFHLNGTLSAANLSLFAKALEPAESSVSLLANVRVDGDGVHATGRFSASSGSYRGVRMSHLSGFMEIVRDALYLRDVQCRLRNGSVNADAEIQLRSSNPDPNRLEYRARNVEFRDGATALLLPGDNVENQLDSDGKVVWRKDDLEVSGRADVFPVSQELAASGRGTELQGRATFTFRNGSWYLPDASFRSPRTSIEAVGQDGLTFHVRVGTSRVAEPLLLLRSFVPSVEALIQRVPDITAIKGGYRLDGDVRVEPGNTSYGGRITVEDGSWRTYDVDALDAWADWNSSRLALRSLKLRRRGEVVEGDMAVTLPQGQEAAPSAFDFRGSVHGVALQSLSALGAGIGSDVSGSITGKGSVSLAAGRWAGEGAFAVANGVFRGEPFDALSVTARLRDGLLTVLDGEVQRGAARVRLQGRLRTDSEEMDMNARLSDLPLRDIPAIRERGLDVDGLVTGSGQVSGTPDNPAFNGTFQLGRLRYGSLDLGHGEGTVRMSDRRLSGSARVESEFGGFVADVNLSTADGFPGKAVLDFNDWNIRRLIAGRTPPFLSELSTALRGRIEVEGKFGDTSTLSYSGELDGARFKIQDYDLHNEGKIRFTGTAQKLQVGGARILGVGSDLALSGDIPLDGSPNLNLRLNGILNLSIVEHVEKRLRVSGSTRIDVRATGSVDQPQIIGQSLLQDARLDYGDLPFRFSGVRGRMVFSRNLVRFEDVEGSVATGTVQLSGAVEHAITEMRGINLQVSVRKARLPYPKDFRSTVDADLVLRGGPDSQVLTGDINVLRSDYLKDLNLLEQFVGRGNASAGPVTTEPLLAGMRLNVSIHSEGGIFIDNELARLRGGMRLTLRGTPAYPSLTGRVEAVEGSIYFRGNRFDIIRAGADFVDRNRINPVLDVRAEADVKSYTLILDMAGDLDHLAMNLSSVPALSTVDIVSLLTTGKSSDVAAGTSRRQAEITGLSAASILSESLTGVIGKRVQRIFGFESFRVDPFLAGAENDPTARVTITERISRDLAVTFSRNLTTSEEQIVVLEYDVTRNVTVVATRDENGKFGLDFRFRKRFR